MKYFTAADWVEFRNRFPDAQNWMTGRELWRERECLKIELSWLSTQGKRLAWIKSRIAELDAHFTAVTQRWNDTVVDTEKR